MGECYKHEILRRQGSPCPYCKLEIFKSALNNLVNKLDECKQPIADMAVFAHIHNQPYTGPDYSHELEAAEEILDRCR